MCDAVMNVDVLQSRLQAWAAWLTSGGSAHGYPTKNVLHSSWLPPAPGSTPDMAQRVAGASAMEQRLHHIISTALSVRAQNTLVVVYVMRAPPAECVQLLGCEAATVRARVREAKALISRQLQATA